MKQHQTLEKNRFVALVAAGTVGMLMTLGGLTGCKTASMAEGPEAASTTPVTDATPVTSATPVTDAAIADETPLALDVAQPAWVMGTDRATWSHTETGPAQDATLDDLDQRCHGVVNAESPRPNPLTQTDPFDAALSEVATCPFGCCMASETEAAAS